MHHLILLSLISLTACATPQTEYVYIAPEIPTETLLPCEISDRQVSTVKQLAALATEHLRSAECANGKIETINEILNEEEN